MYDMLIHSLAMDDMEALAGLYYQFWNEASDVQKMKELFAALQSNDAYLFLGAVEEDQLIGSVMGVVCQELYGDCKPFLVVEDMVVDQRHRNKGVGKALFRELEKQATARDCTQVILVTEAGREDACGFYESLGFHPTANKGYKKKI